MLRQYVTNPKVVRRESVEGAARVVLALASFLCTLIRGTTLFNLPLNARQGKKRHSHNGPIGYNSPFPRGEAL